VSVGPDLKGLDNLFDAKVEDIVYQGSNVTVSAMIGNDLTMKIRANPAVPLRIGDETRIGWNKTDATVIRLEKSA